MYTTGHATVRVSVTVYQRNSRQLTQQLITIASRQEIKNMPSTLYWYNWFNFRAGVELIAAASQTHSAQMKLPVFKIRAEKVST